MDPEKTATPIKDHNPQIYHPRKFQAPGCLLAPITEEQTKRREARKSERKKGGASPEKQPKSRILQRKDPPSGKQDNKEAKKSQSGTRSGVLSPKLGKCL